MSATHPPNEKTHKNTATSATIPTINKDSSSESDIPSHQEYRPHQSDHKNDHKEKETDETFHLQPHAHQRRHHKRRRSAKRIGNSAKSGTSEAVSQHSQHHWYSSSLSSDDEMDDEEGVITEPLTKSSKELDTNTISSNVEQQLDRRRRPDKVYPTAAEWDDNARALRRRHNDVTGEDKLIDSPTHSKGWEIVEKPSSKGDESGPDEFWKSGTISSTTAAITLKSDDASIEVSPTEKNIAVKKSVTRGRFVASICRIRRVWKEFQADHINDVRIIWQERNKCIVGSILLFIFCGMGGIMFHTLEGGYEMYYKCGVKKVKRDFLDVLWSRRYIREDEWKSMARSKLMDFENQLYDAYEAGMSADSGNKGWGFINSCVYSITLVTTIGYGHLAPVTVAGRILTIIYSILGIPLFLILLADYGKLLTRGIKFLWAFVRRLYYTGSCRKVRKTAPVQEVFKGVQYVMDMSNKRKNSMMPTNEDPPTYESTITPIEPAETPAPSVFLVDDEFNLPISVAFTILVLYMVGGASMFCYMEKWSFFESFYFVFISTSTIGLGDFVPKGEVTTLMVCLVYFVFGLSLTSMFINVVTEKMSDSFRQATAKIGATMGLETGENNISFPLSTTPTANNDIVEVNHQS